VRAKPIIIVNGARHDAALLRSLESDPRLTVVRRAEASIPLALQAGRALVTSPWFTVLDDDDVLLPGALATRLDAVKDRPDIDIVVTNGFRRTQSGDLLIVSDASPIQRDPLKALLQNNWLLPGSWLCRTNAIGAELFADMPHHLECTYLAARFASTGRMLFLETPTVAWSFETPGSASKSEAFRLGEVEGLEAIRRLRLPAWFLKGIGRKIAAASHSLATQFLESGEYSNAWRWHLRSLRERGGLRYLTFSRHILAGAIRRRQS
jgi:hypothetical protein